MDPVASGKRRDAVWGAAPNRHVQQKVSTSVAKGEMQGFIAVARILRPQGRKGEVLADILTDFPSRFEDLHRAFLDDPSGRPKAATVEYTWLHKQRVVLKFVDTDSIDDAERLRGRYVLIPEEEKVVLSAGQYYLWELMGCQVVVEKAGTKQSLGTVKEIEPTGGVDLLHVSDNSREILIPFVETICKVIDPANRLIVIDPPEDLLDLNREREA